MARRDGALSQRETLMPVTYSVDSIEGLDESLKPLYVEKDGKFVLDIQGIESVTEQAVSAATRRANKEAEQERKRRKELESKVSKWESLGKSDEEIAELIAKTAELETTQATKSGDVERIKQQLTAQFERDLKKRDVEITSAKERAGYLAQQLESHLIDASATAAIAAHKGTPELLLPIVRKRVKVIEEDGRFDVQVLDSKGNQAEKANGDPWTISDLVADLKASEIYGRAFESTGAMGSGTPPGTTGATGKGGIKRRSDLKTEKEKAAYAEAYGHEAYFALPL